MNAPQTPAANAPSPSIASDPIPNPSAFNGHNVLTSAESEKMAQWLREDVSSGKLTPAQADQAFEQLGIPVEHRGVQPDTRSPEAQQLDQDLPTAKPEEFLISWFRPGQEPVMDAGQKQQLKQFDQSARTWLSQAGFARDHGNSLATAMGRVIETTHAKRADSIYVDNPNERNWIKIKNPAYSQREGRADLFKRAG